MNEADPLEIVKAGYDRLARRWDEFADSVRPPLRERYLDWLESRLAPGSPVVELGSGSGLPVAARLATRTDYLGVDVSSEMISVARSNVAAARFLEADMRRFDLPGGSVDAVIAFYSIIHLPRADQPLLFSKVRRWLSPGGYFIGCLTSGDLPAGEEPDWLEAGPMYWSGFDVETNRHLLTEAGFELIEAGAVPQMEGDTEVHFFWFKAVAGLG